MDLGFLHHPSTGVYCSVTQMPISTMPEKVSVRSCGSGEWQALYEGKWRKVHMQVNRMYIVYMGKKINIDIEGV